MFMRMHNIAQFHIQLESENFFVQNEIVTLYTFNFYTIIEFIHKLINDINLKFCKHLKCIYVETYRQKLIKNSKEIKPEIAFVTNS